MHFFSHPEDNTYILELQDCNVEMTLLLFQLKYIVPAMEEGKVKGGLFALPPPYWW